jgi:hypothetical protein
MRKVLESLFAEIGPGEPRNVVETPSMMTMIALMQESDMLAVMPVDITNFGAQHGLLAPTASSPGATGRNRREPRRSCGICARRWADQEHCKPGLSTPT